MLLPVLKVSEQSPKFSQALQNHNMSKKTSAPRFDGFWPRFLTSPYLTGVNVIFGVVIGIVATMFHEELTNSTPFLWFQDTSATDLQWNIVAIIFWSVLLLFAAFLTGRAWWNAAKQRFDLLRLFSIIDESPPDGFLQLYDELFQMLFALADTDTKPGQRKRQLRVGLEMIIQLAKRWDHQSLITDHYRSNVMLSIDKKDWSDKQINAAKKFYSESEYDSVERHADCGLWVDKDLATEEIVDGDPDNDVNDLMLLVSEKGDGHKTINIEGAPRAFAGQRMQYVPDTARIAISAPNSLNENIKKHIKKIYKEDEKARSIISLPLVWNNKAVGVINIYRNSKGIMRSGGRTESFGRIMSPFTTPIAKIVSSIDVSA